MPTTAPEAQFRLVRDAIVKLSIPLQSLPGDHAFHTSTLEAFHTIRALSTLPNPLWLAGIVACSWNSLCRAPAARTYG